MIEQQLEQKQTVPFYETFMTDRERELFKDFLAFMPDAKKAETAAERKMDGSASERLATMETDQEGEQLDGLEAGLALARELDEYQAEYGDPRLYMRLSDGRRVGPNCFAFAVDRPWLDSSLGIPYETRPYPGYFSGESNSLELERMIRRGDFTRSKEKLESLLGTDFEKMGKSFAEVDKDYVCKDGESLICAMGRTEDGDFHFMRKGENAWFHKPGLMSVSCFDDSGHLIVDPAHCDTRYDMFYGYYVIRNNGGGQ